MTTEHLMLRRFKTISGALGPDFKIEQARLLDLGPPELISEEDPRPAPGRLGDDDSLPPGFPEAETPGGASAPGGSSS